MTESAPRPGAEWHREETRFTVIAPNATAVELCLDGPLAARHVMHRRGDLWSAAVAGIEPGQRYGYRVEGPYDPARGHRFNPAKLLVDPWARALSGQVAWDPSLLGYGAEGPDGSTPDPRDSAGRVPWSVVVDPAFDWQGDRPPGTAWGDTFIYEAHVRGLTQRHPQVPPELRGTYVGLAHEAVIEHLLSLGVTAVELMPVLAFASEAHLAEKGLTNYWGYSPLAWFAPHAGYARAGGRAISEFKSMIRTLHRAGLEVILDVVYNHTVEGGAAGPTLSLRGLDNATYYRLDADDPSRYEDFTGCGNTLDLSQAAVQDLVLASLAYWVEEMHVDGFRFDLAPVLGRDPRDFDAKAPFFRRLARDPVFAHTKFIAEPWDLGPAGYRLGQFPPGWAEWNDRYRDGVRRFWRGDPGSAIEFGRRLAGSPDLFSRRGASASINFVAAHDGFTLADLTSYEEKRNEANGEENRDGSNHDHSANWGVEGPTSEPGILQLRARMRRAFIAGLALARGVPMLGQGDEFGRTQGGNNNAYCQDNEVSWVDWPAADAELLAFTRRAFALRRELAPALANATAVWLDPEGEEIKPESSPQGLPDAGTLLWQGLRPDGRRETPGALALLVNAESTPKRFRLPAAAGDGSWTVLLDSSRPEAQPTFLEPGPALVPPHTLLCVALGGRR